MPDDLLEKERRITERAKRRNMSLLWGCVMLLMVVKSAGRFQLWSLVLLLSGMLSSCGEVDRKSRVSVAKSKVSSDASAAPKTDVTPTSTVPLLPSPSSTPVIVTPPVSGATFDAAFVAQFQSLPADSHFIGNVAERISEAEF